MTFREAKRVIARAYPELLDQSLQQRNQFFSRLRFRPFWIWDVAEHKTEDRRTKGLPI